MQQANLTASAVPGHRERQEDRAGELGALGSYTQDPTSVAVGVSLSDAALAEAEAKEEAFAWLADRLRWECQLRYLHTARTAHLEDRQP